MMTTIILVGSSLFVISEIAKDKGFGQLSKAVLPVSFGLISLWLLWRMIGMFL